MLFHVYVKRLKYFWPSQSHSSETLHVLKDHPQKEYTFKCYVSPQHRYLHSKKEVEVLLWNDTCLPSYIPNTTLKMNPFYNSREKFTYPYFIVSPLHKVEIIATKAKLLTYKWP